MHLNGNSPVLQELWGPRFLVLTSCFKKTIIHWSIEISLITIFLMKKKCHIFQNPSGKEYRVARWKMGKINLASRLHGGPCIKNQMANAKNWRIVVKLGFFWVALSNNRYRLCSCTHDRKIIRSRFLSWSILVNTHF